MLYLGGCHSNIYKPETSLSLWINTTKVQDYNSDRSMWSASGISPYVRPIDGRDSTCFGTTTCGQMTIANRR